MNIRQETPGDVADVRDILRVAFAGGQEADLVDTLRRDGTLLLSLVAEDAGRLVGHVGFSRVWVEQPQQRLPAMSLAPLSVVEDRRRRGVAAALVEQGHRYLRTTGETIVFVLGNPAYYGRFGYSAGAATAFDCAYAGSHFQVLALTDDAPKDGAIVYPAAFDRLQ